MRLGGALTKSGRETEIKAWDDATFLNKAKLTIKGQITNSTIILLGREESEHFLSPAVCKIRWMRKKNGTDENDEFGIFSIPMILAVDEVAGKIKNATYTYTIEGNMFPDTLLRYDVFTIREPLCNAILCKCLHNVKYVVTTQSPLGI